MRLGVFKAVSTSVCEHENACETRTGKHYPSGVGTSKKNTFAIVLMWMYIHSFEQPTTAQLNACSFACAANAEQATF